MISGTFSLLETRIRVIEGLQVLRDNAVRLALQVHLQQRVAAAANDDAASQCQEMQHGQRVVPSIHPSIHPLMHPSLSKL